MKSLARITCIWILCIEYYFSDARVRDRSRATKPNIELGRLVSEKYPVLSTLKYWCHCSLTIFECCKCFFSLKSKPIYSSINPAISLEPSTLIHPIILTRDYLIECSNSFSTPLPRVKRWCCIAKSAFAINNLVVVLLNGCKSFCPSSPSPPMVLSACRDHSTSKLHLPCLHLAVNAGVCLNIALVTELM